MFAGSADWMPRNFYRRIEAVFPIEDSEHRKRIVNILDTYLKDTKSARILRANGAYHKAPRKKGAFLFSAQDFFIKQADDRRKFLAKELEDDVKTEPPSAQETPEA
jgi:polyphosphate kinase